MKTYTITINEDIITLEKILTAALNDRLERWSHERELADKAIMEGWEDEIAEFKEEMRWLEVKEIERAIHEIESK